MALNEAPPRLSVGPFSGIMEILESAAIECLSINVKPITIEKLSSESLYLRGGGKEAGYFYPLPVCGKRDDVPRVGCFQVSLSGGGRESRDITDVRRGTREDRLSSSGKLLLLEGPILFRVMKVRR